MKEIEHGDDRGKTGVVDPPKALSAIAEPDDERSSIHSLAGGFQLKRWDEVINDQ